MRASTIVGVVLIVAGALALAYQGFNYTRREKVFQIGSLQASAEQQKHVSIPPLVGAGALVVGVALIALGRRR